MDERCVYRAITSPASQGRAEALAALQHRMAVATSMYATGKGINTSLTPMSSIVIVSGELT
jgi:hypothetical protein